MGNYHDESDPFICVNCEKEIDKHGEMYGLTDIRIDICNSECVRDCIVFESGCLDFCNLDCLCAWIKNQS